MMPAFSSPAPTRIFGDFVGNVRSKGRLFLYEQCSLHITEKIPSSVYDGSRPRMALSFSYSSGVRLCFWTNSGVMAGSVMLFLVPAANDRWGEKAVEYAALQTLREIRSMHPSSLHTHQILSCEF